MAFLHGYDAEPDAHDPYLAKNQSINMKIKCKALPTMKLWKSVQLKITNKPSETINNKSNMLQKCVQIICEATVE